MKPTLKKIFSLSLLFSLSALASPCCPEKCCFTPVKDNDCFKRSCGYPFLLPRSQSFNLARRIVGVQQEIHKDTECKYGTFNIALEYTRSFKSERILTDLLGIDACNCSITLQGSDVDSRKTRAWLADHFGLPMDFESTVCFNPRIQNFIIDFHWYVGLDEWHKGSFFRLYAPLVHSRWDLNMCEKVKEKGIKSFPAGYMSSEEISRMDLPRNFEDVMRGGISFGDMKSPLKYGLMSKCRLSETRFADIRAELGCNFAFDEECHDYHCGAFFHAAAPAGNRPNSQYLFEPVVGNGKHWEFGAGLTSSYILWRDECEDQSFGVYFDAVVTHLFKSCQMRSFDLCGKLNSRYMLLEAMGSNDTAIGDEATGCSLANYAYKSCLVPAINLTTQCVYSKVNVQADLALKFSYLRKCWSLDLGYNLWARTGEKFYIKNDCCSGGCGCDSYAIKGDAFVYGKYCLNNINYITGLSATQSEATIRSGKNYPAQNGDNPMLNPRIDNPKDAYSFVNPVGSIGDPNDPCELTSGQIKTSVQPKVVGPCDLDTYKSPSALTHKIFGHLNYKWAPDECDDWVRNPYLGIGAEAEFGGKCCKNSCDKSRTGISQWGIWIKAGWSYE